MSSGSQAGPRGVRRNDHRHQPQRQDARLVLPTTNTVLVIDLEATCWESKESKPADEEHEIIEVGWALLDVRANALVRTGTMLVRPVRSRVSEFCTGLTTITQEMVDSSGVTLKEAFDFLVDSLGSKELSWASYGEYDKEMVRRQCGVFGLEYPFGETHTNVKTVFKTVYKGRKGSGLGMARAYAAVFKRPIEGTHHRGGMMQGTSG
jgi:inhibitor of KinA sporulation pathway (predicted exonuclease)